jgi:iron(III) transport system substrate-binding protein
MLLALSLAACGGGDGREVLTVYSPHGKTMLQAFEAEFERANPGIDVQAVDMGSQEVLDRLRTERANPQGDVWFGAPSTMFEDAAADSLLERFVPAWAAAVPAFARDPEGYWHGTYLTPEVIAYNSRAVPADQVPRDWDDVLDPKWKGRVLIRDPMASGTMRTIFGMVVQRSLRATGDTAQGFDWLRRLDGQTKEYVLTPTLLYQKLAREEGVITLWDLPDIEEARASTSYPLEYVIPASGTPLPVDGVAVVRGTRHAEAARKFVEMVGGTPGVLLAVRAHHRFPARTDVPDDSLPPRLRAAKAALRPEPMDWAMMQREGPGWMRHWDEHVRNRGAGR